jgi:2Fe-2S ferredoxin
MPILRRPRRGDEFEVEPGENLMTALQQRGVPVASSCLGDAVCAKCRLKVLAGAENLSPPTPDETLLLERENLPAGTRISCQCRVLGDVSVDAPYW